MKDAVQEKLKAERVQEAARAANCRTEELKAERVQLMLERLDGWRLTASGKGITRAFRLPGARAARIFAALVGEMGDELLHPARVTVAGSKVVVTLTTPAVSGLTLRDFEVAHAVSFTMA